MYALQSHRHRDHDAVRRWRPADTLTGRTRWVLLALAASGLLVIMLGATILHLRRAAYPQALGDSLVLVFVAAVGYLTL